MKNFSRVIIGCVVLAMVAACSMSEEEVAEKPQENETVLAQIEGVDKTAEETLPEGSFSDRFPQKNADGEDYGDGEGGHPTAQEAKQFQREILVPDSVKGKWKAVKIMVGDKSDEEKNEVKIVELGSSFMIGDSGIKVTVGAFFPNFVMDKSHYTSMDNTLINPAVEMTVEENGKNLYKGWAFEKHPTMYAFEHDKFSLQLMGSIAADVS
jgi:hypothetical protein